MIDPVALIQVKAFARQDGAFLGLLWTASFATLVLFPGNLLSMLLALATPFFVGWRLKCFRDDALDGQISFRRAFAYCVYTFFYASVIFALVQFVYFRFLDHGAFFQTFHQALNEAEGVYRQAGIDVDTMRQSLAMFSQMGPVNLAFSFMLNNVVTGFILALPIAAIMRRTTPKV